MKRSWLTAGTTALTALGSMHPNAASAGTLFTLSESAIDFGDVLVGDTASGTIGIKVAGTINSGSIDAATSPFTGDAVKFKADGKTHFSETYGFAPTVRGAASDTLTVQAIDVPDKLTQSSTFTLKGVGVAPVESITTKGPSVTRIGTSSLETVTITNIGDGDLAAAISKLKLEDPRNLKGALGGASGVFSGSGGSFKLPDGKAATFSYAFDPTVHGSATTTVGAKFANGSADGTNQASDIKLDLKGVGVGPEFASNAPGGSIDFGTITQGASATFDLKIFNDSTDDKLGAQLKLKLDPALTDLTILEAKLGGAGFKMDLPAGLKIVGEKVLGIGDELDIKLDFFGDALGLNLGTLKIMTDQDNKLGAFGDVFTFDLKADVVAPVVATPEPGTSSVIAAGLAGLLARRRKRR